MKVVVGLGNPGKQYAGTRHNVGFDLVDYLAAAPSVAAFRNKFQSEVAEWRDGSEAILLVKPQTFMNLSGRSVRQLIDFYKLSLSDLLIVCDDINLPLGKLRVRSQGTHGGQNGLRNIQEQLGTIEYPRLRIGVGAPSNDAVGHVLGKFKPSEREVIAEALAQAAQGVLVWLQDGMAACMNRVNAGPDQPKKPNQASPAKDVPE